MEASNLWLLLAALAGAGIVAWKSIKRVNGKWVVTFDITAVLAYAPVVVATVEQEFKNSDLPKEVKDASRKRRAIELLSLYAEQLKVPLTEANITLIIAAIEAGVYSISQQKKK